MSHQPVIQSRPRELLSDTELAAYLGIKVSTLRKWRVTGQGVPWIKLGSLVRYRLSAVNAYLDACPQGGAVGTAEAVSKQQ